MTYTVRHLTKTQSVTIQGHTDTGAWAAPTVYAVDELVDNGGSDYVCIVGHTAAAGNEPGVGADWEDFWVLLDSSSGPFWMGKFVSGLIHMPATWTAADIGFKVSREVDGTFLPLYLADGNLMIVDGPPVADTAYVLPAELVGVGFVKLWSNTAGAEENQAADRTIVIDLKT